MLSTNLNHFIYEMYREIPAISRASLLADLLLFASRVIDYNQAYWTSEELTETGQSNITKVARKATIFGDQKVEKDELNLLLSCHCMDQSTVSYHKLTYKEKNCDILHATFCAESSNHKDRLWLLRHEDTGTFTPSDQETLTFILPHLAQAKRLHLLLCLYKDRSNTNSRNYQSAITDSYGVVLANSEGFYSTLRKEWNDISDEKLPDEMFQSMDKQERSLYLGENIVIELIRKDNFIHIQARNNLRNNSLTPKERLVTKYLLTGMTYKKIGNKLGISTSTITKHVNSIYKKLDVVNKSELIRRFKA